MPVRARRPAGTAFDARTRPAVRARVVSRILPGRARSARSAPPAPARPAAVARMAGAGPSPRVPSAAGDPVIRRVVLVARGPRNRGQLGVAAGPTVAARPAPAAPAVAVARAAMAARVHTGVAGVTPAVRVDPMARGARAFPPARASPAVPAARTTPVAPAAMDVVAGATSAA